MSLKRFRSPEARSMSGARRARGWVALAVVVIVLGGAGSAVAFVPLPPGAQVNDDLAAGINRNISVSGADPTNADVVGGALVAGNPNVPWAVFRQGEASPAADQIFSRSFAAGAWTTRGAGTVGGRSSANPQFHGSGRPCHLPTNNVRYPAAASSAGSIGRPWNPSGFFTSGCWY